MVKQRYVITANLIQREEDGFEPEEGLPVYKPIPKQHTYVFKGGAPIGDVMGAVIAGIGPDEVLMSVSVSFDEVSMQREWRERVRAAS